MEDKLELLWISLDTHPADPACEVDFSAAEPQSGDRMQSQAAKPDWCSCYAAFRTRTGHAHVWNLCDCACHQETREVIAG